MHVLQISFFIDPQARQPQQLLSDWYSLVDVGASVASAGVQVSVAQASQFSDCIQHQGVTFHFVRPDAEGAAMVQGREFRELLALTRPDVFHVHGLNFPRDIAALQKLAPGIPVLLQDHANSVPRFWRRPAWRRGLAQVDAVAFSAAEQVTPFIEARVLPRDVGICEYPGTATRFTAGDQAEARALTGIHGDPCILWVGQLNDRKDPLCVLRGFASCLERLPNAHLWCCYGLAPLLEPVQRFLASYPALAERVHLIGKVPHERVEHLMRAADIFVLGSHFEGSGFALMEAFSTGVWPVVTDIASFRGLTAGGKVGTLWQCGDAAGFARALLDVAARPRAALRRTALEHFSRELSFEACGRKLRDAYDAMIARRKSRAPVGALA